VGHLGRLLTDWADGHRFRPSNAQMAELFGVKRQTVGNWMRGGTLPHPEALRAVARVTRISYNAVLSAALRDAGYLDAELSSRDTLERVLKDFGISGVDAEEIHRRVGQAPD